MAGRLDGKVTLITGGGSGIGRATAELVGREDGRVVVADTDARAGNEVADLIRAHGGEASYIACDVTDGRQVSDLVTAIVDRYGRLDCAFNNAGVRGPAVAAGDYPEDAWDRVIAVDLKGVWLSMARELTKMVDQGSGSIVNMASTAGVVGWPHISAYSAAKFGVRGLTKAAALEYAGSNIRINAVCPGYTETPMLFEAIDGASPDSASYKALEAVQPMNRMGRADEIAEAVLWLLSDASSYVTGTDLVVDGGYLAGQRIG
jgi:NAD(P)-dependent dehydrogenase (short-subunit alcohol dehydrogenase family)